MAESDVEVAIIGGGAAGIAAGRRLHDSGIRCRVIEARQRLGGRAYTIKDPSGLALDLGCGWLHSADRNPWRAVAQHQHRKIDKTPPPWNRPSIQVGFSRAEQDEFLRTTHAYYERMDAAAEQGGDAPASTLLEEGGRWNAMINAVSTFISGAELDRVSLQDLYAYDDSGVNWRVVEGYGTTVVAHCENVPVTFDCPVQRIDHSGPRIRIETTKGVVSADQVIVAVPSTILAQEHLVFSPGLPDKVEAAAGLPLGLDDKLFIALDSARDFEKDSRLFGRTDRTATAVYHVRPFGRPMIEAFFGGTLATDLERAGERAFFDFASSELTGLMGTAFARRIRPIAIHPWGTDPFALGSYSYAVPGKAKMRGVLAAPLDDRLFFAGEACSLDNFSTAHGGWLTGTAAADAVIAQRRSKRPA